MEPPARKAIIKDKNGKKFYNRQTTTHLNWIYRSAKAGGTIFRFIPKRIVNQIFNLLRKLGFDFSKFLMTGIPHERFKQNASLVFVPDSKYNEIKTSDGKIILPHYLVIEMLKRVCKYDPEHSIAKSYFCVCRMARDCKDYPKTIGCMIVGPGAADMVECNMGEYISLDKAIKFIEKEIIPRKLSSFISVFPGDLRYFWGVKPHHSKFSIEVCFCCACCCVLKKPHFFIPNEPIKNKLPFIDIRGFRAKINPQKCTGIGDCVENCPLQRIKLIDVITKDGKIVKKAINPNCIGCGSCVPYCPNNAIEIVPTESFDRLEDLLGIFEYYDLKKEDFLKKLNQKYQEINKKLI
ncbi:MAG: indolepyruvate ferredoxin oxidoreductase subunit alpha [Promethearchaeota archaeon]